MSALPALSGIRDKLLAVSQGGETFTIEIPENLPRGEIGPIVTQLIQYGLWIAGSLAVLFIVVGGIYYIIAQGDPEKTEKAKKTIKNAIIGAVFILISLVIVLTIQAAITSSVDDTTTQGSGSTTTDSTSN